MRVGPDLHDIRVLVVEDDPMICLMFEDMLSELGCRVVGLAPSLKQASDIVQGQEDIDVAILDVKLGDQWVFPIASELAERGVPVVFSTGMGVEGLPHEWRECSTIPKPATLSIVAGGLRQALERHAATQMGNRTAAANLASSPWVPCKRND